MERAESVAAALQQLAGHYYVESPVTRLASGAPLVLSTHVVIGAHPGPVVGIFSGSHGDEFSTAEVVLALLETIRIEELSGTLLLVPMASAPTFDTATHATVQDAGNLNRLFPGSPTGQMTEMLADVICREFLEHCTYLIDLHSEPDTMAIRCFYAYASADAYGQASRELARASGTPVIYAMRALPGSLTDEARKRGIVAVVAETGGPLPGAEGLLDEAVHEAQNMLAAVGVLPARTSPSPAAPQVILERIAQLRAPLGGLFRPTVAFSHLSQRVTGGTKMGEIVSPYTGEVLATIAAPFAHSILMMVRVRTSRVQPGDPLYIVGDLDASMPA